MDDNGFPAWLRGELDRRSWNGSEFAERVDADPGVVSRWLRGLRAPTPESCARIAAALAVDLDRVLTLAGHRPLAAPGDDPARADLIERLRRVRLTEERAVLVRGLLDAMLSWDGEAGAPWAEGAAATLDVGSRAYTDD